MILVRFLLFLALAAIGVSAALYFFQRDRRYLVFIARVVKVTLVILGAVLLFFLFERLVLVL